MAFHQFTFALLACLITPSASQFVDVEIASIVSPSDLIDGEVTTVTFNLDITPTFGAAAGINALGSSVRYQVLTGLTDADLSTSYLAGDEVTLTSNQEATNLTDDDTTTFSSLTASINLTNQECGNNGTGYTWFCVVVNPNPSGAGWSEVDITNNTRTHCVNLVCKAVVDVGVGTLSLTNPDDGALGVGAGQAIEFDIVVSSTVASDLVTGSNNWAVTAWLSDAETGGTVVASTSVTLSSAQMTLDLSNGTTATMSDLAVTLDLTSVSCDDFSYSCVSVAPSSSAAWKVLPSIATKTPSLCAAVTCGASLAQMSLAFLCLCTILSSPLNQS